MQHAYERQVKFCFAQDMRRIFLAVLVSFPLTAMVALPFWLVLLLNDVMSAGADRDLDGVDGFCGRGNLQAVM